MAQEPPRKKISVRKKPLRLTGNVPLPAATGDVPENIKVTMAEVRTRWTGAFSDDLRPTQSIRRYHTTAAGVLMRDLADTITTHREFVCQAGDLTDETPAYEVNALLGEGGMGRVYEARQTSVDRAVAIKIIKPDVLAQKDLRDEFLAEAIATGALDHPHIVPIHDIAMEQSGTLFYVMKRIKGRSWEEARPKLNIDENLEILLRVTDAVAFAHSQGVIHRDIKPENVMLGDHGEVQMLDWGLSVAVSATAKASALTYENALAGTPAYMAPEMARGDHTAIGVHSDIYLLGAVLYEIVTGHPPHVHEQTLETITLAANNMIAPADREHELIRIALKAMRSQPEKRYKSVRTFVNAVKRYQAHASSIHMTERAMKHLRTAKRSKLYRDFGRAMFGYREALRTWDRNDDACQGLQEAEVAYATCALDHGDLDLASSLLKPDNPQHAPLLKKVDRARHQRRFRQRSLNSLVSGVMALMIAAIIIMLWTFHTIDRNRKSTEAALTEMEYQKSERMSDQLRSAPMFLAMARQSLDQGDLKSAMAHVEIAIEYNPALTSAYLLRAQLWMVEDNYYEARRHLIAYLKEKPSDRLAVELFNMVDQARTGTMRYFLAEQLERQGAYILAAHMMDDPEDLFKLAEKRLARLWPGIAYEFRAEFEPWSLHCADASAIRDLTPLRGFPFNHIWLAQASDLTDLAPLCGMPLTRLTLRDARNVHDFSPLEGLPLDKLDLSGSDCMDLYVLGGMPLKKLEVGNTPVSDLTPLEGLPLEWLSLHGCVKVNDLTPLSRAPLEYLDISATSVEDLTPLHGMPLKHLNAAGSRVVNLDPLRGMTLNVLILNDADITSIHALQGMTLHQLSLRDCRKIRNFSTLTGLQLKALVLERTGIADLMHLKGMPLIGLNLKGTKIKDLHHLKDMPLRKLNLADCPRVTDLAPLVGLPLEEIVISPSHEKSGRKILDQIPTLKKIGVSQGEGEVRWILGQ